MKYDYKNLIINLRNKLVLSQTDFAKLLDVSFASVNRWEKGHFEPNYKTKRQIIDLCKENNVELIYKEVKK